MTSYLSDVVVNLFWMTIVCGAIIELLNFFFGCGSFFMFLIDLARRVLLGRPPCAWPSLFVSLPLVCILTFSPVWVLVMVGRVCVWIESPTHKSYIEWAVDVPLTEKWE